MDASDIARELRAMAATSVDEEELQYVAELVVVAHEDNPEADACVLVAEIKETLQDVSWLEASDLDAISARLSALITGESIADGNEEESEALSRAVLLEELRMEYAIGTDCLVVLEEDEDWHYARITRHLDSAEAETTDTEGEAPPMHLQLEVEIMEFGKMQIVSSDDVVLYDAVADRDDEQDRSGLCEMCERAMHLTMHHLTPRVMHTRYLAKGYSKDFLNTCALICRPCHSRIHATEDNKTLAQEYNTIEKLMRHPKIIRWVNYARKQRVSVRPAKKDKWRQQR